MGMSQRDQWSAERLIAIKNTRTYPTINEAAIRLFHRAIQLPAMASKNCGQVIAVGIADVKYHRRLPRATDRPHQHAQFLLRHVGYLTQRRNPRKSRES